MKVNIFGLGYVGCISAACMAKSGHYVTGIDISEAKVDMIRQGKSPIIEPGLEELLKEGVASGHLVVTKDEIPNADVSIVCVGTPSRDNGSLELVYMERVVRRISEYLKACDSYHVVNIRSTVLPGTVETLVLPILEEGSGKKVGKDFGLCMNPEFMREGTSVEDYYNPPFTVIGEWDKRSGDRVADLYAGVEGPVRRTTVRVAEMIKYTCNVFHALKVSFANEIGNICKKVDVDSHEVMDIFCMDKKLNISPYYMKPGFAFGGSCLPKDLRALMYKAKTVDLDLPVLGAVMNSNSNQVNIAYRMIAATGKKKIGMFGLSFKTNSDDLRESPMVELAEKLIGKGFEVTIFDQEVSLSRIFGANKQYINQVIPHVSSLLVESPKDFADRSEVVVIAKKSKATEEVLEYLGDGQMVIDLVRIKGDFSKNIGRYEGICW